MTYLSTNRITNLGELINKELEESGHNIEAYAEVCVAIAHGLLSGDEDRRLLNDLAAEQSLFNALTTLGQFKDAGKDYLLKAIFGVWVKHSKSPFAAAYRLGNSHAKTEIVSNNVKRAANGRRLIGATSRAKVAKAAESFRHLSKEQAAASMAGIVNLDPGTIRRYLTELFPGNEWKQ